jgi:hypothetical protein
VDWDVEAFYQFGSFGTPAGDGEIAAWSVASSVGHTFESAPFHPRLGLRANVISGDDDPGDPDLQTFNALFPKGKYFGEIGLLGPYNLINVHPALTLKLTDDVVVDLACVLFWRHRARDGIYNNAGYPIRSDAVTSDRFIGTQLEVALTYAFSREIELSAAYGVSFPGRSIQKTGSRENTHFVGIEFSYRF